MLQKPMPNIGLDLQRIHRVITRGMIVALQHSQEYGESRFPDETTREGFWKYCQGLEANTHGHHLTEDDLFFPFVQARLPELKLEELRAEHQVMVGILDELKAAREAASPGDVHRALVKMADVWYPHIAKEEIAFSPEIMGQVMTVPEHIDLAQKAAAHSSEHAQPAPLSVPFLLYNLEGDDRAHFLGVMPAELTQQLVPIVWKDEWAAMIPFLLP